MTVVLRRTRWTIYASVWKDGRRIHHTHRWCFSSARADEIQRELKAEYPSAIIRREKVTTTIETIEKGL